MKKTVKVRWLSDRRVFDANRAIVGKGDVCEMPASIVRHLGRGEFELVEIDEKPKTKPKTKRKAKKES